VTGVIDATATPGVAGLTGVGGIVSFCIGATGFGVVVRQWLE